MKESIEVLMSEHRSIEEAVATLVSMSNKAEKERFVDILDWEDLIKFIKEFADRRHHAKEEDFLFKLLIERGLPYDRGPIAVMESDHREGRTYAKGMSNAVTEIKKGDLRSTHSLVWNANAYSKLLPVHIMKEDSILYPLAEQVLTEEDNKYLMSEYKKREEKGDDLLKKLKHLVEKYGKDMSVFDSVMSHNCLACRGNRG